MGSSPAALAGDLAAALIDGRPLAADFVDRLRSALPGTAALSVALATRDGAALLIFPVVRAGAAQTAPTPLCRPQTPPSPPRPTARAGPGTAAYLCFQTAEPLRSGSGCSSSPAVFADWAAVRAEVEAAHAPSASSRCSRPDPASLTLTTAPLEARGGVLGAVTLAAWPADADRGRVPGRPAAPRSLSTSSTGTSGSGRPAGCSEVGGGTGAARPPSYPAADGLVALAAALGPCLALARVEADLARAGGGAPPDDDGPPPAATSALRAAAARLAAAGYDADGNSLSASGSGSDEDAAAATEPFASSRAAAVAAAVAAAAVAKQQQQQQQQQRWGAPPAPRPPPTDGGYDAAAARARARWDGPRLGLLAAGGAWWAVHCSATGGAAAGAAAALPLLPAALLACLRAWAGAASPPGSASAWYASRRDALAATPRAAVGLLALAAGVAAQGGGGGAGPPAPGAAVRCACAWLAAWALLVPARFATLVGQHALATALAAGTAAAASGAPRDAASIAALGGLAPLAAAAVLDEWRRDAYHAARLGRGRGGGGRLGEDGG